MQQNQLHANNNI